MACAVKGCGEEYTKGIHISISLGRDTEIKEQFILICQRHLEAIKDMNISHYSLRAG